MRHIAIRTGAAALVLLALGASCSEDDAADPAAEARSEPPTTLATAASAGDVDDVDDDAPKTSQARAEPPMIPAAAPVEFTACVNPGPEVHVGTEERSDVSLSEGDMIITWARGDTWRLNVSDVSDPRLDGTWYVAIDEDRYTLPGGGPGPSPSTWTHRIETDEGAWQGSFVNSGIPDREISGIQYVLVGEGAHEGLTAVMIGLDEACPNTRGYIIDGYVPLPPVPQTGQ